LFDLLTDFWAQARRFLLIAALQAKRATSLLGDHEPVKSAQAIDGHVTAFSRSAHTKRNGMFRKSEMREHDMIDR
jgi:hypothetical protein